MVKIGNFNNTTNNKPSLPPAPPKDATPTTDFKKVDKPTIEEVKETKVNKEKQEEIEKQPKVEEQEEPPKTKKVSFWVTPTLAALVKKVSYHQNTSVSKLVEDEIVEWLENPQPFPMEMPTEEDKKELKSNGFYLPIPLLERFNATIKEKSLKKNPILQGIYEKIAEKAK